MPMLPRVFQPEKFISIGVEPPKGVLMYGPPGTGKTLCAKAIANQTDACFIRVNASELIQRYVGEVSDSERVASAARYVQRDLRARGLCAKCSRLRRRRNRASCFSTRSTLSAVRTCSRSPVGERETAVRAGVRFKDAEDAEHEVQRTMLELVNQLDGFDARGNIKVLMATNRPDTLDPALVRPGRLDRKVEFRLPDCDVSGANAGACLLTLALAQGRKIIFEIHSKQMNVQRNVRFGLLARLCVNATGAVAAVGARPED